MNQSNKMNNYQLYSNYCALLIEMKDGKEKSFKFFLFVQKKKIFVVDSSQSVFYYKPALTN